MNANSRPVRDSANAIGGGTKRRFRTRKEWHVMGDLGERGAATLRIYAPNNDAAIAEAHARGMSVHECIQIPATRK